MGAHLLFSTTGWRQGARWVWRTVRTGLEISFVEAATSKPTRAAANRSACCWAEAIRVSGAVHESFFEHCLLLGIVVAKATQRLNTTGLFCLRTCVKAQAMRFCDGKGEVARGAFSFANFKFYVRLQN